MAGEYEGYLDDDQRRAGPLDATINPLASQGIDPDDAVHHPSAPIPAKPMGVPYQGARYSGATSNPSPAAQVGDDGGPRATAPSPVAPPSPQTSPSPPVSPNGQQKTWQDYARESMDRQMAATQAQDQTVQGLAAQPDESTVLDPLEKQRAQAAAYIDPSADQYKPTFWQKLLRGAKGVVGGIQHGGVIGGLEGGLSTDYKAPNRQYGLDVAKQQAGVTSLDQQIATARKAYEDQTNRIKGIAAEQKSVATGFNDVGTQAAREEQEDHQVTRDAETTRHNQADEKLRGQQETNTSAYQQGELANRNRATNIEASRLAFEKHKFDLEQGKARNPGGNPEIRQPEIDAATAQFQAYKDNLAYKPKFDNYQDRKTGKVVSKAEYIDQLNKIGSALDEKLAAKKQPVLGLRYNSGPNGQEIPYYTPESIAQAQAARQQSTDPDTLPAAAVKKLKKGIVTTFNGGARWMLDENGKPVKAPKAGGS
jgi:hypothetical protein